jgi:hypothetical protein
MPKSKKPEKLSKCKFMDFVSYDKYEDYADSVSKFMDLKDHIALAMRKNIEWKNLFDEEISNEEDALNIAYMMDKEMGFFYIGFFEFAEKCLKEKYKSPLKFLVKESAFERFTYDDGMDIEELANRVEKFLGLEEGDICV